MYGDEAVTLAPDEHEELLYRSIQGERDAASVLFVAGPALMAGGVILWLVGSLFDVTYHPNDFWYPTVVHGTTFPILGACVSGLGAALLGTAVGLTVDHGSRHRAIEQRFHWSALVEPLPGGGVVSLSGTF